MNTYSNIQIHTFKKIFIAITLISVTVRQLPLKSSKLLYEHRQLVSLEKGKSPGCDNIQGLYKKYLFFSWKTNRAQLVFSCGDV